MTDADCARVLEDLLTTVTKLGPVYAQLLEMPVGDEGPVEVFAVALTRAIQLLETCAELQTTSLTWAPPARRLPPTKPKAESP